MANDTRQPTLPTGTPPPARHPHVPDVSRRQSVLAGGTDGNERLTVLTGLLLIVLFAALGITIIRIGQLLWLHLFLGLLLLGPVALKLLSTGYRFARYYTSDPVYREKGPPAPALRGLAPLVVFFTLTVFATGVALLVLGPSSRQPLVLLHKASFFAWIAVTALHVLGHLPEILRLLSTGRRTRHGIVEAHEALARDHRPQSLANTRIAGRRARGLALVTALLSGLVLAVAFTGQFSVWTHGHPGPGRPPLHASPSTRAETRP